MYNRLSTPFQKFFEGLTASFAQPVYQQTAKEDVKCSIYTAPRGAPENIGSTFDAVHPVIRTNPVTGMNSIYAFGQHLDHINEVTDNESQRIMDMIKGLLVENHDLQVCLSDDTQSIGACVTNSQYVGSMALEQK